MISRLTSTVRPRLMLTTIAVVIALVAAMTTTTIWALSPGPLGNFFEGGDGDLVASDGHLDWKNFTPPPKTAVDPIQGTGDDSFSQGKEDDEDPSIGTGSISGEKSDLLRFHVASEVIEIDEVDNVFLYLAWIRANTQGSANIDFEFNQSSTLSANGVTPQRTENDMLITYSFGGNNDSVDIGLSRWVTDANGTCESGSAKPCWGPIAPLTAGGAEAGLNSAETSGLLGETIPEKAFGEVALNMTAAGVFSGINECVSFGSAYVKSRSSASFSSSLKDFIAPIVLDVSNCGSITIEKQTEPSGDIGPFDFTGDVSGLLGDGDSETEVVVQGSYSSTESDYAGWDLTDISCDDANSSGDIESATANFEVSPGENVTCTFTNTKFGEIVIEKQTTPPGAADSFIFSGEVDGNLADGGMASQGVSAGQYTSTGNCSELRGSEQPAAFQEGIETSGPPGAKEGCQGHLAVGALP